MPSKSKRRRQAALRHGAAHSRTPVQDEVDWVYCYCEEGRRREPRRAILLTTASNKNGNQGRKFFKCRRKTGCNFFLWLDEYERIRASRPVEDAHDHEDDEPVIDEPRPGPSSLAASSSNDGRLVDPPTTPVREGNKRARSDDEDDVDVKPPPSVKKVRFDVGSPKLEDSVEDDKLELAVEDSKTLEAGGTAEETVEDSKVEEDDLSLTLDELYVKTEVEAAE
ncbi:hypothetical protein JCM9279_000558 [Rhodotorula babjevae]